MDVYKYVAESNPVVAKNIIESFGYEHASTDDMGLSQLVAKVGEPALKKIMENHPDKDIILELFSEKSKCDCASEKRRETFLNITGNESSNGKQDNTATLVAQQTNAMLLASALFIFTALIILKK
jgi:hypothetical protein